MILEMFSGYFKPLIVHIIYCFESINIIHQKTLLLLSKSRMLRRPITTIERRGINRINFSDWGRGGRDMTCCLPFQNLLIFFARELLDVSAILCSSISLTAPQVLSTDYIILYTVCTNMWTNSTFAKCRLVFEFSHIGTLYTHK
jgi:hypothetical protein